VERDEAAQAVQESVGAFEVIFREEWEYTEIMIGDESEGATLLEPKFEDESEDWGAREALSESIESW
jgi:hypothetical protein